MIGEIWIQANMNENGIVDLMTMENKKCIDADALELAYRRIKDAESLGEHSGGYVYNRLFETLLQAPEVFPAGLLRWIKTAERKPTAEDANEDGCVLSININPGDMNTVALLAEGVDRNFSWGKPQIRAESRPPRGGADLPFSLS